MDTKVSWVSSRSQAVARSAKRICAKTESLSAAALKPNVAKARRKKVWTLQERLEDTRLRNTKNLLIIINYILYIYYLLLKAVGTVTSCHFDDFTLSLQGISSRG